MKILIVTPFYPPDLEESAVYIKETARRLSKKHTVSVITYGKIPEVIPGVTILVANKYQPFLVRLIAFTVKLLRASYTTDVIYAQNGPSTEVPVIIVSLLLRRKMIFRISDIRAHERARRHKFFHALERIVLARSRAVISDNPVRRPIISPFSSATESDWSKHEHSWQRHIKIIESALSEHRYGH